MTCRFSSCQLTSTALGNSMRLTMLALSFQCRLRTSILFSSTHVTTLVNASPVLSTTLIATSPVNSSPFRFASTYLFTSILFDHSSHCVTFRLFDSDRYESTVQIPALSFRFESFRLLISCPGQVSSTSLS